MLSILIPIYNFDVGQLVSDLHQQSVALGVPVEILAFDDGSSEAWKTLNRAVQGLEGVHYLELPNNIGRAAIRNFLAHRANYDHLLFLDCDAGIVKPDYLQTYLSVITEHPVVCGGTIYADNPPPNPECFFRWYYGRHREQMDVHERASKPWYSFMTNNFVIRKDLFVAIGFDEKLTQYGHEDTLFGMELARRQVPVLHIDNPVVHLGLDTWEIFLRKTDQAIENLLFLRKTGCRLDTRLMNTLEMVEKWKMAPVVRVILKAMLPLIIRNLSGKNVHLKAFDLYKLYRALAANQ